MERIPLETNNSEQKISFNSFSFFPYSRGFIWYATYILALIILVYFALRYSAALFASILIFTSGLYLASTLSKPKAVRVSITDTDLELDINKYPLKDFDSYWIEPHGPNFGFLHFFKKSSFAASFQVPYIGIENKVLSDFMQKTLEENESSLAHSLIAISHILKI